MVSTSTVLVVLVVEAVALAIAVALLVGHGVWLRVRRWRLASALAAARSGIIAGIVERPDQALPISLLAGLPTAERLRVLGEAEPIVAGAQRDQVRELARRAGLLDRAGRLCRSRRWKRRLRGARIHTLLGGGEDVMPKLFGDRRNEVRAEAAVWGGRQPDGEIVQRLLALLDDEATLCRFTVRDSLLRIGPPVVEPLAAFLATASGGSAVAALEVAAALRDPRLLDAAFRLVHDDDATTRARATDLLAALGGEKAAAALLACLGDRATGVRAAAARGLGHGRHWSAAPQLAAALRDRDWEVRQAAGTALRLLGAPGELLLRRMLGDEDRFAADMARLMLDVPGKSA